ncbi:HNH endonuclease [Peribacillus kribbensis]|uniref:HNH endonuclease n=1 Tax=Peribacillus kribbensis TaxID=356658 RepID=UPI00047AF748|nr:HNH endonuclease [Peribacillus kribbensis]
MSSFIVMQGHTYEIDRDLGIIWIPKTDKGGNTPHSWGRMKEVKKGDQIFHYVKGNIVAISIARGGCIEAVKPSTEDEESGNTDGYLVHLSYHELEKPVHVRDHFDQIAPLLPLKYSPFQPNSDGNQGYLYPCHEELAIKLLELMSELNIYLVSDEQLEFSIEEVKRTEHNTLIPVLAETESEVQTKLRLGQQKFRRDLMPLWNGQCVLCGISLPELLQASHAKPWKDSTNSERIDPYNGVLLCSNHHALYQNGFIAFDGQGRLHISSEISEEDYVTFGIEPKTRIKIYPDNKVYVKWHKRNVFRK